MLVAHLFGLARRVQRIAEEHEAGGRHTLGGGHRGHPPAVALAAAEHRPAAVRAVAASIAARVRGDRVLRRARAPAPGLDIGEVEPQGGHPRLGQRVAEPRDERVVHAGAGTVGDHQGRRLRLPGCQAADTSPRGRRRSRTVRSSRAMMHGMAGRFYLGTSGFAYDEWRKGVFYPEDLKKDDMLDYYSTQLSSVEINYTFRRFPTEKTVEKWRAKARRRVRVHAEGEPTDHALEEAGGRRRGRPRLRRARETARRPARLRAVPVPAVAPLRRGAARRVPRLRRRPERARAIAMEFRHDSWSAARERPARAQGVGWCVAQTDEKDPAPEDLSWEPAGYLRLRKTEYSDEELAEWAARIRPALDGGADVFCYFKHEDRGASPQMAKRLEDILRSKA